MMQTTTARKRLLIIYLSLIQTRAHNVLKFSLYAVLHANSRV